MTAPAARTITVPASTSGGGSSFNQGTAEILDYSVDWTTWLAGDTISSSTWVVDAALTKVSDSHTTLVTTAFISGGSAGRTYNLTNTIVTAASRTAVRTFTLTIMQYEYV